MKFTPGMTAQDVAAAEDKILAQPTVQAESSAPAEKPLPPKYWGRNHEDMGTVLVERYKEDLRFINDRSKSHSAGDDWAVWNGEFWDTSATAAVQVSKWQRDMTAELKEAVREMLDDLLPVEVKADEVDQAAATADEQDALNKMQKAFYNFYKSTKSDSFQRDWRNQVKIRPQIQVRTTDFDRNHYLLNCKNGTIDLRTGELIPFSRKDNITKQVEIEYDPNAYCPTWAAALNTWQNGDREIIGFLQRLVGYFLTGDTSEQIVTILFGPGANGKTVFTTIVSALLGDYATAADVETFLENRRSSQGPSEDVARLRGRRLVIASEPNEGRKLNESLIKSQSGGDKMTGRMPFQQSIEFDSTHKLVMLTNHKPVISGTDNGIWRRLRLIPFTVTIEKKDPKLTQSLLAELPGILAWAVRGAAEWATMGLRSPESVTKATDEYRGEQDLIEQFIKTYCDEDALYEELASNLFALYEWDCEEGNIRGFNKNQFGRKLTDKGFAAKKVGSSQRRLGLAIKAEFRQTLQDIKDKKDRWKARDRDKPPGQDSL